MNVLKDSGYGVTRNSLNFWRMNKDRIGNVLSIEVRPSILVGLDPIGCSLEYTCAIYGTDGTIYLSGCNCGYGGEGPNGTAKILADVGVPIEQARRLMLQERIDWHSKDRPLL